MPRKPNTQDIQDHAGPASLEDLALLARHYYADRLRGYWAPDPEDTTWETHTPRSADLAQSIVVRSEIQPLNICMPRFALRTRFENDKGNQSILHLRRLAVWQQYVSDLPNLHFAERTAPEHSRHPGIACLDEETAQWPLRKVLGQEPPLAIADSLLTVPSYISARDYHIVHTRLHRFIGEDPRGNPYSTPYAYTAHRSGGLCAQSCCFMATALLHQHARTVCGIADISYLAKPDDVSEVFISGLDETEMNRYFAKVGLAAPVQSPPGYLFRRGDMEEARHAVASAQVLRCLYEYTLSNIPTILIVDATRLEAFYDHNGLEPLVTVASKSPVLHTLLCVGCERGLDGPGSGRSSPLSALLETVFVLHDPSGMPFMRLRGKDLLATAAPLDDRSFPILGLMPVVPGAVRVPLLRTLQDPFGLMELAGATGPDSHRHLGFCLVQAGSAHSVFEITRPFQNQPEVRALFAEFCSRNLKTLLARHFGFHEDHWIWIERQADRLILWDAQVPLDDTAHALKDAPPNRLAEIQLQNGILVPHVRPSAFSSKAPQQPDPSAICNLSPPDEQKTCHPLRVGVISSFVTRPYSHSNLVPDTLLGVEVYAFMSRDLLDLGITTDRRHPVHVLADAERVRGQRDLLAGRLANALKEYYSGQVITGFATYLPELRSPIPAIALMASRYFQFLVRTAAYLGRIRAAAPVFTIELVAGAIFDGIWPAISKYGTDNNGYGVNLVDKTAVHRRILRNLFPAVKLADRINTSDFRIQFAFESEPGALFALHTFRDLIDFVGCLDGFPEHDPRHRLIGLNCDIPHWAFLSDVTLEKLSHSTDGGRVTDRIVHAHISDHTEGHWADNPLYTSHRPVDFAPWIGLLKKLGGNRRPQLPRFSGWISVELEACRDPSLVRTSAQSVEDLCG